MLGQDVTDDPEGAVEIHDGYEKCMEQKLPFNYLQWIARQMGIETEPKRPTHNVSPMDRHLGKQQARRVLIFPKAVWTPRRWPVNYWLSLAEILREAGIDLAVVLQEPEAAFMRGRWPAIHSLTIEQVTSAIRHSSLVIGNDSGPAHLAGTLGIPTLALQGPTTARIYGHLPEVRSLIKGALSCAGCHCLSPYRASCEEGCHDLYRLVPEDVASVVLEMLGEKPTPRKGARKK
jgi:ADP-heptose:LPS heptosyltransferase